MDTTTGQVISVEVRIWTTTDGEDVLVARLLERFMVRGRTGSADLPDPAPLAKHAKEATRARLDRFTVTAPTHMGAFAAVSGDHNPLHTDVAGSTARGLRRPDRARHVALGRRPARGRLGAAPPSTRAPSAAG